MPGPAPKFDPVRRNPRSGPVKLPAAGRQGPPPRWPLSEEPEPAELDLWAQLWSTPQAVAWEGFQWSRVVARYCRVVLRAEELEAVPMAEARQLEDRLGLTPKAMRLLLWEVADVPEPVAATGTDGQARRRIRAVE